MIYDYAIIGGGVIGCSILNKLTRLNKKCVLLEKYNDVGIGTTKANTALVHAGFDAKPGTMKARFNVEGSQMMEKLCKQLSVPYKQNGALVVGNDLEKLNNLLERGKTNGVKEIQIINKSKLHKMVPNLSEDINYALFAKTAAIISPYELAIALAEESVINGAVVIFNQELKSASFNSYWTLKTNDKVITAKWVINCTGYAFNEVSSILNAEKYPIQYRVGEYYLLDSTEINLTEYTIFPLPSDKSKGVVITPTVEGNILIGPNAIDIDNYSTATTKEGLQEVKINALKIFPGIKFNKNIRNFAGVRSVIGEDFIIERSKVANNIINIAGICSPGLSSAPAIAKYVTKDILGLNDIERKMTPREPITHTKGLTQKEINKLIKKDPKYGEIICRCEQVSKAEIIQALNSPLKPTSVDAIKRRTRAGMGRCQGGFCLIDEINLIAKTLNIPMDAVVKESKDSNFILGNIKEIGRDK